MVPDTISREIGIDAPVAVVWPIVTEARHLADADENAKAWIVELYELRTYAAQATASPGER